MRTPFKWIAGLLVGAIALAGCTISPVSVGHSLASGGMGLTPGGAQDIGLARKQIEAGSVPRPDSFQIEGLFAEHDLPLDPAPAGKTVHATLGLGIAPAPDSGKRTYFVQVGMSSGLAEADFRRPHLDLAIVADRSGSMSGDRIVALKQALHKLVDRLDSHDRLALVAFDHEVVVMRPLEAVNDKASLKRLIDTLEVRGATDIEAGLRKGYELLQSAPPPGTERRVMLFTDALPNTGRTDPESFHGLVSRHADQGIGLTAFGIGLDFGAALAETIGNERGGNYVFLKDAQHTRALFDQDFDYLVTPAAYDLEIAVKPADGLKLAEVYGAGSWTATDGGYALKAKTLFFSRHRGAFVLRLEESASGSVKPGAPVLTGSLRYVERDRQTLREDRLSCGTPVQEAERYFSHPTMRKTVALTTMGIAMQAAARGYHASPRQVEGGRKALEAARAELHDARTVLDAPELDKEIALVDTLRKLVQN